ncbi:MAG: DUF933 domain-containing protein [Candidatus Omnitrophica bacterium]|nr:DUF933 domain-containing protein [Candidatus Omnitrophota bacterium]
MKIGVFGLDQIPAGKIKIIDERLDAVKKMFDSKKAAYFEIEIITDLAQFIDTSGIIVKETGKTDLVLTDLELVEKRLSRCQDEKEMILLKKFKEHLEKEEFLSSLNLGEEEKETTFLTSKPIFLVSPVRNKTQIASAISNGVKEQDLENNSKILFDAYTYFGYISFFTANEKEARAWPIKKGTNAWQASGRIHSDIQKGFIRAEIISYEDLIKDGSFNEVRSQGHLRLEQKDYIIQNGDFVKFRFSK